MGIPAKESNKRSAISSIEKDKEGYIWIGTDMGLLRYNGTKYKRFRNTGSESIASDCILSIRNDTEGRLWVASDIGLTLFQGGDFSRNILLDVGRRNSIANMSESDLVISAEDGLYDINKSTGEIIREIKDKDLANSRNITMGMDMVCVISDSPSNTVSVLDRDFRIVGKQVFNAGSVNSVASYMGEFYIGTTNGIKILSAECKDTPLPDALLPFKDRNVLFTSPDDFNGELLIGIKDIGIFRFNGRNGSVTRVWQSETLSGVTSCTCIALSNNIAICKNQRVLAISKDVETQTLTIPGLHATEYIRQVFSSAHDNNTLVFTDRGIYLFNILTKETNDLTRIILEDNPSSVSALLDKNLNIWTVNRDGVLTKYLYERNDKGGIHYSSGKVFSGDYSDSKLFSSGENPVGIITPRRITIFDDDDNSMSETLPEGYSHNPYTDAKGNLYLYGKEGIYALSQTAGGEKIPLDVEAECMAVDNYGNIWAGTDNDGIYVYYPENGNITHYGKEEGLPENSIRSLVYFRDRMWICCRHYIAYCRLNSGRITVPTGDSELIMNYSLNSGTEADIPSLGNRIIFASNHELTVCNPYDTPARKDISLSMDYIMSLGLNLPTDGKMFVLPKKNNNLLFSYSAITYDSAEFLSYEYKLEGHDEDWIKAGNSTEAVYVNLEGGEYVFRVRVQTTNGEYSPSEISIPFKIKKALMEHWWAKLTIIAFILAILVFVAWLIFNRNLLKEVLLITRRVYDSMENEAKRFILHSRNYGNDINIITAMYSPVRELEEDKDLKGESRKLVNSISRGLDSLTKLIADLSGEEMNSIKWNETALGVEKADLKSIITIAADRIKSLTDSTNTLVINEAGDENGFFDVELMSKLISISIGHLAGDGPSKEIRITTETIRAEDAMQKYGHSIPDYEGQYSRILLSSCSSPESIKERILKRYFSKMKKKGIDPENEKEIIELLSRISKNHKGIVSKTTDSIGFLVPSGKDAYSNEELRYGSQDEDDFSPTLPDSKFESLSAQFPERRTVLIAENNKMLRDLIADIFRPVATLVLATNGKDAFDLFEENDIDLSILDTTLPSLDGYSLCSKIKHSPKGESTPVILISANKDLVSNLKANDAGADAFIEKPFHKELLMARGSTLIQNYEKIASASLSPENSQSIPLRNPKKASESDRVFITRVSQIIEENLSNETFTVNTLVEEMGTSYSQFFSRVKKITGYSPKDILLSARLEKAKELLKGGENNVSEIAYMVGFSSLSSFSRAFKNKFGTKPSSV